MNGLPARSGWARTDGGKKNSFATRRAREGWSSDEYGTPWGLIRWLEEEHGFAFTLDPCATRENRKASRYFDKQIDGLKQPWTGEVWVNPPFSSIGDWVAKAVTEARQGADVTMIVPVRSERDWWHQHVLPHAEIWFQRGRQRFVDPTGTDVGRPVFASAILRLLPGLPAPGPWRSIPSIRAESSTLPLLEAIG